MPCLGLFDFQNSKRVGHSQRKESKQAGTFVVNTIPSQHKGILGTHVLLSCDPKPQVPSACRCTQASGFPGGQRAQGRCRGASAFRLCR
jgi:hypothetical protein